MHCIEVTANVSDSDSYKDSVTPQCSEHASTMKDRHAGKTLGEIAAPSGDLW